MRVLHSSKILVLTRATWHNIPEDSILLMHNILGYYLQNNNILLPEMFGFRKGMSIEDVAFKLTVCQNL
jgi:hypothetical protein